MARVAGVNIVEKKHVVIALTSIFGIGLSISNKICKEANINPDRKVSDLSSDELGEIRKLVGNHVVESDLKRQLYSDRKKLEHIKCRRAIRFIKHLPVRGQRTRTNGRTRKRGKR